MITSILNALVPFFRDQVIIVDDEPAGEPGPTPTPTPPGMYKLCGIK